jgi:hypothetical protein
MIASTGGDIAFEQAVQILGSGHARLVQEQQIAHSDVHEDFAHRAGAKLISSGTSDDAPAVSAPSMAEVQAQ